MQNKKVFIVAGELSSDTYAANLVKSIKLINPAIDFYGLGGKKMSDVGVKIYHNLVDLAVVGFFEVLKNYPKFKAIFNDTLSIIDILKPDCIILIDYPGFNLRLAKEIKKRKIKIIYYISPQVWAWGKGRIKLIKKYVDKILVIFKFEEDFYKKYGIDATFVGHPLLEFLPKYIKQSSENKIAVLPGSRIKEINFNLPIMLKSIRLIKEQLPLYKFVLIKTPTVAQTEFDKFLNRLDTNIEIVEKNHYEEFSKCSFAIVASGTATVETAILEIPFVIVYRISNLTAFFLKHMIKIPYIGMVNILAGKKIIEEFLQEKAIPEKIADYTINILNNPVEIIKIKYALKNIKGILQYSPNTSASETAAKIILQQIS
ncbi:MAG: lipid-A-disaccharide synthase [Candidatus Omnitrophota bacterium]